MQTDLVYSNMSPATLSKPKGSCLCGWRADASITPTPLNGVTLVVTDVCPYIEEGCTRDCQCLTSALGSSPFPSLLWGLAGDWGHSGQLSVSGVKVCHSWSEAVSSLHTSQISLFSYPSNSGNRVFQATGLQNTRASAPETSTVTTI